MAQESTEETLFAFAAPVSLTAGHSASAPILDANVPAARVSLLAVGASHPLAAVRVANGTGSSLPAGVLTLYGAAGDTPYAGDARLGGVPAHESRLVSYAQDLRTAVEWRTDTVPSLAAVTASTGVLTTIKRDRRLLHATLKAPAQDPRHVLVEVPKMDGTALAPDFAQPAEQTATSWRLALDLAPGETRTLTFALDRDDAQSITMLDGEAELVAVAGLPGLSEPARAALARIAALRTAEAAATTARDRLTTQQEALDADESRLRENLAALQPTDALRTRLVRQLDADETRHGQLATALDTANAAVDKAHAALAEAVQSLRL